VPGTARDARARMSVLGCLGKIIPQNAREWWQHFPSATKRMGLPKEAELIAQCHRRNLPASKHAVHVPFKATKQASVHCCSPLAALSPVRMRFVFSLT